MFEARHLQLPNKAIVIQHSSQKLQISPLGCPGLAAPFGIAAIGVQAGSGTQRCNTLQTQPNRQFVLGGKQ